MLFSVEQAFVGRDEKRALLKMSAWEAIILADLWGNTCLLARVQKVMVCVIGGSRSFLFVAL